MNIVKNKIIILFFLYLITPILLNSTSIYASQLSIVNAGLGSDVQNRTLIGESDIFVEGGIVFFFTKVVGGENGDTIYHVWIQDEIIKAEVPLAVGGPIWRTWSRKNLYPNAMGNWRVEARSSLGEVIDSRSFKCILPGTRTRQ